MTQEEGFSLYLNHIYDSCLSLIQLWDTRDVNTQLDYGALIKRLVDIERIVDLVKVEMVEDASKLG